jgi:benzoate membrane transport protein
MTLVLAPFGGFSINLSSVTAAICTGPDTHPDPAKRYLCGPVFAVCYLLLALGGVALTTAIVGLPPIVVAAVAGIALLGPLAGALATAMHRADERFAAVLAFIVTASNLTLLGVGGAFWGLLAGVAALGLERLARKSARTS